MQNVDSYGWINFINPESPTFIFNVKVFPSTKRTCSLILWDMNHSCVMDHTDRGSKMSRWGKLVGHTQTFNDSSFLEVSMTCG